MDPFSVYTGVKTAMSAAGPAIGTIQELCSALHDLQDRQVTALTNYTKRTLITSRVYIEDQLANEELTPKLLKLLNSMYSGFVLSALGLTNLIASGKTVRSMTAAIATEDYHSFVDKVKEKFGDAFAGASLEDNKDNPKILTPTERQQLEEALKRDPNNADIRSKLERDNIARDNAKRNNWQAKEAELKSENAHLFTGRLLEVDIPTDDRSQVVKLYFYVQLLPQVTPQIVMEEFLRANVSPSLRMRWAMWKAGEISFWKGFVFEADRVARRKKALKVDKDGILREMEDRRLAMLSKKHENLIKSNTLERRRNLCNSIIICTKRTIDSVSKDIGINMKSYSQRQGLLNDLMAIMLVVVDTNYGTVDLYMNGIETRGEYTAKAIETATKSNDKGPLDTKELLMLMSAGSLPRI